MRRDEAGIASAAYMKKAPDVRGFFLSQLKPEAYFLAFFAPLTACLATASMFE